MLHAPHADATVATGRATDTQSLPAGALRSTYGTSLIASTNPISINNSDNCSSDVALFDNTRHRLERLSFVSSTSSDASSNTRQNLLRRATRRKSAQPNLQSTGPINHSKRPELASQRRVSKDMIGSPRDFEHLAGGSLLASIADRLIDQRCFTLTLSNLQPVVQKPKPMKDEMQRLSTHVDNALAAGHRNIGSSAPLSPTQCQVLPSPLADSTNKQDSARLSLDSKEVPSASVAPQVQLVAKKKARKPAPPITSSVLLQAGPQAVTTSAVTSTPASEAVLSRAKSQQTSSKPFGYSKLLREFLQEEPKEFTGGGQATPSTANVSKSKQEAAGDHEQLTFPGEHDLLSDLPDNNSSNRDWNGAELAWGGKLTDTGKVRLDNGLKAIANALKDVSDSEG
ncbi:hypothetical protein OIO90_002504 [Microbotryomycetes sp. JL221]|nr:hypothetical protein OIO90_002504 [Microbotryomycetes sp. JL221]